MVYFQISVNRGVRSNGVGYSRQRGNIAFHFFHQCYEEKLFVG